MLFLCFSSLFSFLTQCLDLMTPCGKDQCVWSMCELPLCPTTTTAVMILHERWDSASFIRPHMGVIDIMTMLYNHDYDGVWLKTNADKVCLTSCPPFLVSIAVRSIQCLTVNLPLQKDQALTASEFNFLHEWDLHTITDCFIDGLLSSGVLFHGCWQTQLISQVWN